MPKSMLTELVRSQAHLARDEPTTQDVVAPPPPPGPAETLIGAVKELASVLKASFRNLIDDSTMPTFATFPGNIWDGTRNLFITGTLACGVWHRGDDIHLVCLTADRADTFWAVVQEELRLGKDFKTPKEHNIELSSDKQFARQSLHSIVGKIVRLCEINKCKMHLHYLNKVDYPNAYTKSEEIEALTSANPALARMRDMEFMSRDLKEVLYDNLRGELPQSMSQAYRELRRWATAWGIFSARFGFLDNETLLLVAYKNWASNHKLDHTSSNRAEEMLRTVLNDCFEEICAACRSPAAVQSQQSTSPPIQIASRPAATLSNQAPNIAGQPALPIGIASRPAATVSDEASNNASEPAPPIPTVSRPKPHPNRGSEIASGPRAPKSVPHVPAATRRLRAPPVGLHSPSGRLLTERLDEQARRTIENLPPMDYDDKSILDKQSGWRHFLNGCQEFLKIDYEIWAHSAADQDKFKENVIAIVKERAERLYKDPVDDKIIYFGRVWPEEVNNGGFVVGVSKPYDYDLNEFHQHGDDISSNCYGPVETPLPVESKGHCDFTKGRITVLKKTKVAINNLEPEAGEVAARIPAPDEASMPKPRESSKFRTEKQAISRLRNDPKHAAIDYDLAYEDRFDGIVWTDLATFGLLETEDEDFIPMHRVRQIKRHRDGFVVWDRANKIDKTSYE